MSSEFTYRPGGGDSIILSAESTAAYRLGITEVIAAVQAYATQAVIDTGRVCQVFGDDQSFVYRAAPIKVVPAAEPLTVLGVP